MFIKYEEEEVILPIIYQVFNEMRERISNATEKEDLLNSVRLLHHLLESINVFNFLVSHTGILGGLKFEVDEIRLKTYDILINRSTYTIDSIKEKLFEHPFSFKAGVHSKFSLFRPKIAMRSPSGESSQKIPIHLPREGAPQYFFSYAHADYISEKISSFFKAAFPYEIKLWIDKDELHRFHKLPLELSNAIDQSRAAILLLSDNYLKSKWCSSEWQAAIQRNLFEEPPMNLYVTILDNCEIPALLKPYFRTKLVNFPSAESYLELIDLIRDIQTYERKRRA